MQTVYTWTTKNRIHNIRHITFHVVLAKREWNRVQMLACGSDRCTYIYCMNFGGFLGQTFLFSTHSTSALVKGTYYFLCQCNLSSVSQCTLSVVNMCFLPFSIVWCVFVCVFVFLFFVCLCAYFWYVFFVCTPPLTHYTRLLIHTSFATADTHPVRPPQFIHTIDIHQTICTHQKQHSRKTHKQHTQRYREKSAWTEIHFNTTVQVSHKRTNLSFECRISNTSNSCAVPWVGCLKPPSRPKQIFSSLKKV